MQVTARPASTCSGTQSPRSWMLWRRATELASSDSTISWTRSCRSWPWARYRQIHLLLLDYFLQLFPYIPLPDDDVMTQTRERPILNEIILQVKGIPPHCIGGGGDGIWAREPESQGGNHMRQMEF